MITIFNPKDSIACEERAVVLQLFNINEKYNRRIILFLNVRVGIINIPKALALQLVL